MVICLPPGSLAMNSLWQAPRRKLCAATIACARTFRAANLARDDPAYEIRFGESEAHADTARTIFMNISYLLALIASALFGSADFAGGVAARRGYAAAVTAFSGLGALAVLAVGFLFIRGTPTPSDFGWAVATGVC